MACCCCGSVLTQGQPIDRDAGCRFPHSLSNPSAIDIQLPWCFEIHASS
jgi:hypothetical protein